MVQYTQLPYKTQFAGNPIVIEANGTNYQTSPGTKAQASIKVYGTFTFGSYIEFSWLIDGVPISITMYCVLSPDDSGTQFSTTFFVSESVVVVDQLNNFRANPYLNEYFDIEANTLGVGTLTFIAKNVGTDSSLTITTDDPNVAILGVVAGTNEANALNHYMEVNITVDDIYSGQLKKIPTMRYSKGKVLVDVGKFLQPYLKPNILDWGQKAAQAFGSPLVGSVVAYYVEINEYYGILGDVNNTNAKASLRTPSYTMEYPLGNPLYDYEQYYYAHRGGLKDVFYRRNIDMGIDQFQDNLDAGVALTTRPYKRYVTPRQPEYITIHDIEGGRDDMWIRYKLYFDDGTDSGTQDLMPFYGITYHRYSYVISAGFLQNNFASFDPSKKVWKYEIWVDYDKGGLLAGPYEYYLQMDDVLDRYFVYEGSQGQPETLRCRSASVDGVETQAEEFRKIRNLTDGPNLLGDVEQFNNTFTETIELSTGVLHSKQDLDAVIDFLHSPQVCEVRFNPISLIPITNFIVVPVLVEKGSYSIKEMDNGMYSVTFRCKYAVTENHYTNSNF